MLKYCINISFLLYLLFVSMKKLFGQSFRIDKSQSILAMKVFCSWDFKVMKKTSVKLQSENISTQLKVSITRSSTLLSYFTHLNITPHVYLLYIFFLHFL